MVSLVSFFVLTVNFICCNPDRETDAPNRPTGSQACCINSQPKCKKGATVEKVDAKEKRAVILLSF